jgi:hypothetical protein
MGHATIEERLPFACQLPLRPDHGSTPKGPCRRRGLRPDGPCRRYIEEGIRQDEHPLIYFREGAAGRRPALLGSRLGVAEAIETIRQKRRLGGGGRLLPRDPG